jgi:2,3-bisphosphoglycerate-independent phosphoglycerate mutase
MNLDLIRRVAEPADSTIVLLVLDGLGGLSRESNRCTELESARTPNLDDLAASGECGLQVPVAPGITPGSGPGHLGLFGYDPVEYHVGRGVLSALGVGFDLQPRDVAARGNFCTVDESGVVTDRRAGRISTDTNRRLRDELRKIALPGVEVHVETVKEHRFLLVLRGDDLSGAIEDTDPQEPGHRPRRPEPREPGAARTSDLVSEFVDRAGDELSDEPHANMVLLRGFAQRPNWPTFPDALGLDAACIADYPMYRGVSKLVGMDTLPSREDIDGKFAVADDHWSDYDFFFIHEKRTDRSAEDGNFSGKKTVIEEIDQKLPQLLELAPDVVVVTGDHSTPARMKSHSWHPVPVTISGPNVRADHVESFGERACREGALGPQFPGEELMALALANAGRLAKYGA